MSLKTLRLHTSILIVSSLLLSSSAKAYSYYDEGNGSENGLKQEEEVAWKWRSIFIGGASFAGKDDFTDTFPSFGGLQATGSDYSSPSALFAGEITYQSATPLGLGLVVEGTRFRYNDGSGITDGEFGILGLPRLAAHFGKMELWAGVGLGVMFTSLGGPSSQTVGSTTATLNSMNSTSFAWSPRVGIDFALGRHFLLGFQVEYMQTTPTFDGTYTAGANSGAFTASLSRSWCAMAIRLGTRR